MFTVNNVYSQQCFKCLQSAMSTFHKRFVEFILLPSHTPWQVSFLAQYNTVQYNAMQILLGVAPLQGCKM